MKQKQTIAIIHFNTPELTEACILSIRKHGCDWPVVVFDNSEETLLTDGDTATARPFKTKMKGVRVIDNTKGQIVYFEQWLNSIPNKNAEIGISGNYQWGSARHIYTVQKLWELLPDYDDRGNWFDTGATMLDDILKKRPRLKGLHLDIRLFIEHYGGGSWHKNDLQRQSEWLKTHEALWSTPTAKKPSKPRTQK